MKVSINRKTIAAGSAALLVAVGGGAAIAATGAGTPAEESEAIIDDAAAQLGVDSAALSAALKDALSDRVDAAVAAGRITEEQAAEIKERIASSDYPILGFGGRGHHGPGGGHVLAPGVAAEYLGVTEAELRAALDDGKSLADVAEAEGKSVDGLVDAIVAAAKERLQEGVDDGRLTDAQRDEMVAGLEERVTEMVDGTMPRRPEFEVAPAPGSPA